MHTVVDGNILGLLNEFLVHQHREAVDRKHLIRFFRFIQNHGQGGPASPARMQKDTDRSDLLVLEILFQNLFCCFRNMDH